jgi:hypothetical protein
MTHGAAAPAYRPTAWAYLASGDCTIRRQRGDNVAYIFEGKQLETYPDEPLKVEVFDTIPALPKGWTEIDYVRRIDENWVRVRRKRCQKCGIYS